MLYHIMLLLHHVNNARRTTSEASGGVFRLWQTTPHRIVSGKLFLILMN